MKNKLSAYILHAAVVLCFGPEVLIAQFDTERSKTTEVIGCLDSVSLLDVLTTPPVPITRSLANFQIGLNWYGMDGFSQYFGVGPPVRHVCRAPRKQ